MPVYPKSVPAPRRYFSGVFLFLAGSSRYSGVLAYFPEKESITLGRSLNCQRAREGELSKKCLYLSYIPSRIIGRWILYFEMFFVFFKYSRTLKNVYIPPITHSQIFSKCIPKRRKKYRQNCLYTDSYVYLHTLACKTHTIVL